MILAAGIDLGGTKIETQFFDEDWQLRRSGRMATPKDYATLREAVCTAVAAAQEAGGADIPIGIGSAGILRPNTGVLWAANLPVEGHDLLRDVRDRTKAKITFVNDARALILSEAAFGVAKGKSPALGISLGTGFGAGLVVRDRLLRGHTRVAGELGHTSLPAAFVQDNGLPLLQCGCGRVGCVETLLSGPGLTALVAHKTGQTLSAQDIADRRHSEFADCWTLWVNLLAQLLEDALLNFDPQVVILAGGLSQVPGLREELDTATAKLRWDGFAVPEIVLAEGGETSAARGAAFAAYQAHRP